MPTSKQVVIDFSVLSRSTKESQNVAQSSKKQHTELGQNAKRQNKLGNQHQKVI